MPFSGQAQNKQGEAAQANQPPSKEAKVTILSHRDLIMVKVFMEPALTVEQRIDGQGNINVPLLGYVKVAGLSEREAEDMLEKKFIQEEYLRNPQISISIREYAVKEVSILGEIKKPGILQFPNEVSKMDIREVISRAGGFTSISKTTSVRVTRKKEDGKEETFTININDIDEGDKKPFYIYPDDMITVPQRIF